MTKVNAPGRTTHKIAPLTAPDHRLDKFGGSALMEPMECWATSAAVAARSPDSPALAIGVMLFAFIPILCQPAPAKSNH